MKLRLDLDAMEVTTFEVAPAITAQERVTVGSQTCGVVCNWTD